MQCHCCQAENEDGARFCENCGARLEASCPACGAPVSAGKNFCRSCGAALTSAASQPAPLQSYTPRHLAERILDSRAALEGERKQVTVLFADLKGSMELLADRDPEDARKLLDPVLERMMEAVHHYEGTVNQVMGDGIMALFGAPLAHEDHAVRACYAALRMQEAIRRYTDEVRHSHGIEVRIRVGINSGEVVVRTIGSDLRMDYTAVGQTTHLAARMEQLATPGTARLTANTLALAEGYIAVRVIGPVPVKGIAQPVEVYELTGAGAARTRLQAAHARGLTRFVGRDTELDQLRRAAEDADHGRGQIVAVVGEPGVGKSRLYYEFIHSHRVQGWLILESGSVSYGKATPYLPLADLLRDYFKIDTRDDTRGIRVKVTGGLLTLDESLKDTVPIALWLLDALPDDSPFLAVDPAERRRQTLTAVKRILLRENHLHPLMLVFEDLHWIDSETQTFLNSLVDSLPASRILLAVNYRPEYRHGWGNKTYYHQIRIDPLPPQSAEVLLDALVGADPGTRSLKQLLIARTAGSPLFLEESVRTLVETGALEGERGAYRLVQAPHALQVPATVQAIIASRIDRLDPLEKRLLQAAAVVGTHVPFELLRAVSDADDDTLKRSLAHLQTAEFIYEAQLFPDLEYAFKHALTHEVAYNSVLQDKRRALHAAIVDAIERLYAGRLQEQIERLAHHAARSGVSFKAARYLRDAGVKAAGGSASRAAIAYFEEALAILGELPRSTETLTEALEIHIELGPALINTKGPTSTEVEHVYRSALELVDELGLDARRFIAQWGLWYVDYTRGNYAPALESGDRLLDTARKSSDSGQLLEAHHSAWPTLFAMGRVKDAFPHMEAGCAIYDPQRHGKHAFLYAGHDPGVCARYHLGVTRWLLGYPDQGLADVEQALAAAETLGHPMTTVITLWFAGWLRYQRGDRAGALANLERMVDLGTQHEFMPWTITAQAFVEVLRQPRIDAETIRKLQQPIASAQHITSWRRTLFLCALAELSVNSGHADAGLCVLSAMDAKGRDSLGATEMLRLEGELLALKSSAPADGITACFQAAIELARERGQKSFELRAALSLARFLDGQGRRDEARAALVDIYGFFTEGYDTADLKTAKSLLASLT